jgi:hypothetical protein
VPRGADDDVKDIIIAEVAEGQVVAVRQNTLARFSQCAEVVKARIYTSIGGRKGGRIGGRGSGA